MNYCVSDIHAKTNFLKKLIEKIIASDNDPKFIFIGDYGDRGEDSRGTIDYLISLSQKYPCVFLRGNHDDVISFILTGKSLFDVSYFVGKAPQREMIKRTIEWWSQHGFSEFLKSYNIPLDAEIEEIRSGVPKDHIDFYANTRLFHSEVVNGVNCVFVHAFYHPKENNLPDGDLALAEVSPERNQNLIYNTLWLKPTDAYLACDKIWDKTKVVLGHTPCSYYNSDKSFKPVVGNNVVMIDSGSCFGGYITAYCLENDMFISSED